MDRGASKRDLNVLIDRLDELVHNAKAVPFTDQVRLSRDEIYDLLDQIREIVSVPSQEPEREVRSNPEIPPEPERDVWADKSIWEK